MTGDILLWKKQRGDCCSDTLTMLFHLAVQKHQEPSSPDSLTRISIKVEIYYLHAPDVTTPIEETLEAINIVHKAGKFRHVRYPARTPSFTI
jgi:predicted oxidoreductase